MYDSTIIRKPFLRYLLLAALMGYILFYIYAPITLGLDWEDLATLLLPCVIGLTLFQQAIQRSLLTLGLLPHAITGFSWALVYPLLFQASYTKPFYFYEFAPDYLFGLALFIFLTLSQITLGKIFKKNIIASLYSILDVLLLVIPAGQLAYFLHVGHCITPATMMAFYMTNPKESYEYVLNGIGITGIAICVLAIFALLYLFYRLNLLLFKENDSEKKGFNLPVLASLSICLAGYAFFYVFSQTNVITHWIGVRDYMREIQQYNEKHADIFKDITLTTNETAANKVPGTIILVIGESGSRSFMKAFNPNFAYDNTPWQSEKLTDDNFYFFPHSYSSYVQTVPTLERALTERNQYNDREFLTTASILDIAKKAGYKTYWFSNQGVYGAYDTTTSLIAKQADVAEWAHQSFDFSDKYDEALLPLLEKVNPNENNFIVMHVMGSHIYYNDRYPSKFSVFKKTNPPTGVEAYANSILYNDWVLSQMFEYAKEHLHLQAMVHFSDHGESIETSHNPDVFDFDMTRIPFWAYLSPAYKEAFPVTATTLRERTSGFFTNDLLYDFMVGIMQAPSNRYDATRDMTNPAYRFNADNVTTMLGTRPIKEDPEIKK